MLNMYAPQTVLPLLANESAWPAMLLIVPDVMMAFSDHGGRLRLTDARGYAISEVDCMTL